MRSCKIKVLNLYAGIGGNRKLWEDVEVTAVESNPEIAKIYKDFFPADNIIIGDAHQYLLDHFREYDFIWSSPPCQSHSKIRYDFGFKANRKYSKVKAIYADMALYQEILFLKYHYEGKFAIENTIPYYEPLINGCKVGGHLFWSNFFIRQVNIENRVHDGTMETLQQRKKLNIDKYDISEKRQILRNCVEPELGLHVLNESKIDFISDLFGINQADKT